jgi:hypothetical protein
MVLATLPVMPLPDDPNSQAIIWQVKDDNNGIIEVKGGPLDDAFRFFVLFHKDQVSLTIGATTPSIATLSIITPIC